MTPVAISSQNSRSSSQRCDGAPGEFIGDRPVNSFLHPVGLPINSLLIEVLRPPIESSQYLSIRYTQWLAECSVVNLVGSRGDSYDNTLAETMNGLYKTELVRNKGPWRGLDDLELATLEWVDWFNHRRLFGELGHIPPAEFEDLHYPQHVPTEPVGTQTNQPA